jgi:uncharacterized protein YajQ (UPF0234 family)
MRIELDSSALDRLIGGDTEVELHLRKQIVQEFAKRQLKVVAETTAYGDAVEEIKQHVNKLVKEHFGVENLVTSHLWPTIDYRLKSMIESLVKEHAQKAVDVALLEIIEHQKHYWNRAIEAVVKKNMDRQIEKEIEKGIRERLEAALKIITDYRQ